MRTMADVYISMIGLAMIVCLYQLTLHVMEHGPENSSLRGSNS